jgi:hypothetical protein
MPWECIAPFCGLAAPELGFHVIQDDGDEEAARENANLAVITIKEGDVTARQVEGEFKAQAGQNSTWRWYAKKIADKKFQMKFPTASKVEELAFFNGMEMRTVPGVKFKVDKWNPHVGAKAEINTAWFRISGVPTEKRSEKIAALIASLVGVPFEVDKNNLKRGDYIRVKIGCRDISKVPARVEGLLDRHFYDFTFQREVPVEGASTSWNTWTRNADRNNEDNPSPKKQEKGREVPSKKGKLALIKERGICLRKSMVGDIYIITKTRRQRQERLTKRTNMLEMGVPANRIKAKALRTMLWMRRATNLIVRILAHTLMTSCHQEDSTSPLETSKTWKFRI